jgi:mRNA interferase MazF
VLQKLKRGQIYYADLGDPVGSVQGGRRPVLILQNDVGNEHATTTIIAPMTRKKRYMTVHVFCEIWNGSGESCVMLEQIRTINKDALVQFVGEASDETMREVDKAIKISLSLEG